MSQRTRKLGPKNGQLDLPFVSREPVTKKHQCEPITVRIPEAMRLIGIGRSKLYELIASGGRGSGQDWSLHVDSHGQFA